MCCVDWPLARTLLHVWVEISLSESLRIAFEKLKAVRMRLGEDSQEEEVLRAQFLKTYGAGFRMWVLRTCCFTHGANRQLMWNTFLAKFYGLSRPGIRTLSQLGLLSALTSVDRHWKSLLLNYRTTVRYEHRVELSRPCDVTMLFMNNHFKGAQSCTF